MKKLLPLFILILSFSVFGQVKKTKTQPTSATFVFSESVIILPSDYTGATSAELSRTISEFRVPKTPQKDEFEKTVDYEERLKKWRETQQPVSLRKTLLTNREIVTYNADSEILSIYADYSTSFTFEERIEESTYEAQNGFGAKVTVKKTHSARFAIQFEGAAQTDFTLKTPPATAQNLKFRIRTLLIFDLVSPYSKIAIAPTTAPTFLNPFETSGSTVTYFAKLHAVWLIDSQSGKVLAKKNL